MVYYSKLISFERSLENTMSNTRYVMNDKNILSLKYELLYICNSKFENDWHSTAHFHPFTEIFFITSGTGCFQLDDKTINVFEGDLVIINPNCLHTEKSSFFNEPLEYIVLGVDNLLLTYSNSSTLVNNNNTKDLYVIMHYDNKDLVLQYLDPLIKEIKNKSSNYEIACKSLITLLIIFISRSYSKHFSLKEEPQEKLNIECMKIKNYIDSHYSENITLDFLADLTYVNKFHLVHSFTKQVGLSPINYVITKRIDEAKSLLTTTNYSIRDISSIVGFSNSSYFSQMFKKMTGKPPKAFRLKS